MGITERKEREKQEMRQRILEAAMNMFLQEGYERTSIRNIAEKIEYSPATIYLYYKDKDELLYAVQHEAFGKLEEVFSGLASVADPFERLRLICTTYVRFGLDHPELYDLMFILKAPMNSIEEKQMWSNGHDAFEFLLQTVDECMAQGLIRFTDRIVAALSIWAVGHGLISLSVRCRMKVVEHYNMEDPELILKSVEQYLSTIKT